MRGLLLRLYESDPDAGASLRLIEYFDELLANRASIDAIVRATAMIAEWAPRVSATTRPATWSASTSTA